MTAKNLHIPTKKTNRALKQHFPLKRLLCNNHGISPVISAMMLVVVVVILGFSALSYANTMSDNYRTDYHDTINSDIDSLKETLSFECCFYNSGSGGLVLAYFMNAGSIPVNVDKVYLSTSIDSVPYTLNYMNGTSTPNKILPVGAERQIIVNQALSSGVYTIKITTVRGSSFAFTFSV